MYFGFFPFQMGTLKRELEGGGRWRISEPIVLILNSFTSLNLLTSSVMSTRAGCLLLLWFYILYGSLKWIYVTLSKTNKVLSSSQKLYHQIAGTLTFIIEDAFN